MVLVHSCLLNTHIWPPFIVQGTILFVSSFVAPASNSNVLAFLLLSVSVVLLCTVSERIYFYLVVSRIPWTPSEHSALLQYSK